MQWLVLSLFSPPLAAAAFEFSLGILLIVKGFEPTRVDGSDVALAAVERLGESLSGYHGHRVSSNGGTCHLTRDGSQLRSATTDSD
jgi:hypothetical protein